jgi:hypothetical protein
MVLLNRVVRLSVVVLVTLGSIPAFAQQTSGIAGVARDTSGAVLPGVTVEAFSPALIEKVRTVVTDGEGRYNIVDLRPGQYVVTFTLPGFSTFKREGIQLTAGFTANVNANMQVGALEETVTVTGAAPLVDTQNVRQQTVVSNELLEVLPSGQKTLVGYAKLIPGLQGGSDVGGAAGLWATGNVITDTVHGKGGAKFSYDGMQTNNYGGNGATSYLMNPATVVETAIEVGGISAESNAAGISMNLIPKEGSNTRAFMLSGLYSGESLQSDNVSDRLHDLGVKSAAKVLHVYDMNAATGGPIKRDRLWFFTATRAAGNKNQVSDVYFNLTRGTPFYTPDLNNPSFRKEWLKSIAGRVTWQASEKHKINGFADVQNYMVRGRGGFEAPESHTVWSFWPAGLYQTTWTAPLTSRLLLEAGWSLTRNDFPGSHKQSTDVFGFTVPFDHPSILEVSTGFRYNARATYSPNHIQYRVVERFSASYVTGSHAFKAGFQTQQGIWNVETFVNSDGRNAACANCPVQYRFLNGTPIQLDQWATPYLQKNRIKADLGVFAQDQWTIKRLTLNYGLRLDYFNSYVPPQHVPATPWGWLPERNFEAVSRVPEWIDLNPRMGASYDLFGNGRTALKASLGRYVGVLGIDLAQTNNPINTSVNSVARTWADTNGNYIPDCDLGNFGANGECGPISDQNFGRVNPRATRFDEDLIRGFGKRDYFWDLNAQVQHEIMQGMSVQGAYSRNWTDQYGVLGGTSFGAGVTDNLLVSPADFDPFCVTAPSDPRLPGGGGYQVCGMYDINPARFGQINNLVTRASKFGDRSRISDFFTVKIDSRFDSGIILGASVDTGRTVEDNCYVVDAPGLYNFSSGNFGVNMPPNVATTINGKQICRLVRPFSAQTQVKVHGSYTLPGDVVVSGILQNLPGAAILADYPALNSVIAPSLGRNLAACGTRVVCTATATVPLIVPYTEFEPRRTQLDLRIGKVVRVGRTRLQANVDVYNVLNDSAILNANRNFGPRWRTPLSTGVGSGFLEGRLVQFSGQATF